jgi:AmiR/NasT family two-component response regulator
MPCWESGRLGPVADNPPSDPHVLRYSEEQVSEIVSRRAVIEQVKGMLMYAFDVDAQGAFAMLRSRSRSHHVKVQHLAEQILNDPSLIYEYWGDA